MRNLNRPKLALRVATLVIAITLAIPLAFLTMRPQVAHAAAAAQAHVPHEK